MEAVALAAALTLVGLRMQPLKDAASESKGFARQERDPEMGSRDAAKALAEGQRAASRRRLAAAGSRVVRSASHEDCLGRIRRER
jgi:hypothetical protein